MVLGIIANSHGDSAYMENATAVGQSLTESTVSVLDTPVLSMKSHLQIHVFGGCASEEQVLHESECGTENEGSGVQSNCGV